MDGGAGARAPEPAVKSAKFERVTLDTKSRAKVQSARCVRREWWMHYNVAQILKEPTGSTRRFTVEEGSLQLDDTAVDRLDGWLLLTRTDAGIWVHGSLVAEARAECGRCLEGFTQQSGLDLDEQYYPSVDSATGALVSVVIVEDDAFRVGPDQMLDISDAVRQHLIARAPMKPLCRPDCAGICPECGADRNGMPCVCADRPRDPPLARLFHLATSAD